MDIDWTSIRGTLARVEQQLSRAREVIRSSDAEAFRDWPEVTRKELEFAYPDWRTQYGNNWIRDFMDQRIGKENYRIRQGSRKYRIAPECWQSLNLTRCGVQGRKPAPGSRKEP